MRNMKIAVFKSVFTAFCLIGGMLLEPNVGWSMGLEQDIADYMNENYWDSTDWDEIQNALNEQLIEHGYEVEGITDTTDSTSTDTATSSETQITTTEKETQETTTKTQTVTYSHDYDTITDEARNALSYFSLDGVSKSMYLNILNTSEDNLLYGAQLNLTKTNNETAIINFVNEEGTKTAIWTFTDWTSDDNYYLDLTTVYEEDEELENVYVLSLQDTTLPEDVEVKLNIKVDYEDESIVEVFTKDADGNYVSAGMALVVDDGYISIKYTDEITSYYLSTDNLIELYNDTEDASTEASSVEEITEITDNADVETSEIIEEKEEIVAEDIDNEEPNNIPYAVIIFIIVIIVAIATILLKKLKKN